MSLGQIQVCTTTDCSHIDFWGKFDLTSQNATTVDSLDFEF